MPQDGIQETQFQSKHEDLTLQDVLMFVRRRWLAIIVPAVIATAAVAVIVSTRAPIYQSTATLDLPTEPEPDLKRVLPTPQAYQIVLESLDIKQDLARQIEARKIASAEAQYVLRTRLNAVPPPAVLEATVEARSAAAAAAITEEWIALFQERIRQIAADAKAEAKAVKEQSKKAKIKVLTRQLDRLREQKTALEVDFSGKLDEATQRFMKKCIEHRQNEEDILLAEDLALTDAVMAYETETQKLLREPDFRNSVATMKIQIDGLQKTYGTLQEEQTNLTFQTPQPNDAAVRLQQLALSTDACAEKLQNLMLKLQEAQTKRDTLERDRTVGLRKLREEHAVHKDKLTDQLDVQLTSLERQRNDTLGSLNRSKSDRMMRLDANMDTIQNSIDELAMESSDADQESRMLVRVLASPVAPAQPQPAGLTKYALLGFFGGLLLGVALAVIVDAGSRTFQLGSTRPSSVIDSNL